MLLHLSVILSTVVGGGCLLQYMPGYTPPWEAASRHHPPREADTPRSRHPPQTATAADGTHPTGMHSCTYTAWEHTVCFSIE